MKDGGGTVSTSSDHSFRSDVSVPTWQAIDSNKQPSGARWRGQPADGISRRPLAAGNGSSGMTRGIVRLQAVGVRAGASEGEDDLLEIVEAARRRVWGEAAKGRDGNEGEGGKGGPGTHLQGVRSRTAAGRMEPWVGQKGGGASRDLVSQRGGSVKESRVSKWLQTEGDISNDRPAAIPNDKGRDDILALLEAVSERIRREALVDIEVGPEVRGDYGRESESEELMAIMEAARERIRGGLVLEDDVEEDDKARGGDDRVLQLLGMKEEGEFSKKEESLINILEAARRKVRDGLPDKEEESTASIVQDERVLQLLGLAKATKEEPLQFTSTPTLSCVGSSGAGASGASGGEDDGSTDKRVLRLLGMLGDDPDVNGPLAVARPRPRLRMG